jgi:hypothetical protein
MAKKLPELDDFSKELVEHAKHLNEQELINLRKHINSMIENRVKRRILAAKLWPKSN